MCVLNTVRHPTFTNGSSTCADSRADVIIVEDDPYFFLQYPEYNAADSVTEGPEFVGSDEFLRSLTPSMLQFDHQGRVIRLESFSKTLAPGLRLGYFVANPLFTERLLRATEVETQDPSGLSQALTLRLLQSWGIDGYLGWLQGLGVEYCRRRDWMIDAFSQHFRVGYAAKATGTLVAHLGDVPIFSFVPPTGGMFIWACFNLAQNPAFEQLRHDENVVDPEQVMADQLWRQFAEAKVSSSHVVSLNMQRTHLYPLTGSLNPGAILSSLAGAGQGYNKCARS